VSAAFTINFRPTADAALSQLSAAPQEVTTVPKKEQEEKKGNTTNRRPRKAAELTHLTLQKRTDPSCQYKKEKENGERKLTVPNEAAAKHTKSVEQKNI
jgi:hypothetical protein